MKGKIGLEEHFAINETAGDSDRFIPTNIPQFSERLRDLMDLRLRIMDEGEMDVMILSLNSPAIQAVYDKKKAVEIAKKANDAMAEAIERTPKRFRGFAALPLQDVDEAIKELHRTVKDLGCVGVLVNGYSNIDTPEEYHYLDEPMYRPFWAELEKMDIPFYMHPRDSMPCNTHMYSGHPWLVGAPWTFGVETAAHTLRLMCSGLFDDFPKLKFIIGHLGEMLPFTVFRTQSRLAALPVKPPAKRQLYDYMKDNMWFTTSGNFRTQTLLDVILEFSASRVLFATDYPWEEPSLASKWLDECSISETDKYMIARQNSIDLFHLTNL